MKNLIFKFNTNVYVVGQKYIQIESLYNYLVNYINVFNYYEILINLKLSKY